MKKMSSAIATSVLVLLSACGGGSGGQTTPSNTVPPVVTPTVTPANLQTSVVAPNYPLPQANNVFNEINLFRSLQGLGLFKQDLSLDISTNNHNNYCDINQCYSHTEETGRQGFTGINPGDRAVYANYGSSNVSEVATGISYLTPNNVEKSLVGSLINTVYHRGALMSQTATDIGISYLVKSLNVPGAPSTLFTVRLYIDLGKKKTQNNASDFVTVYPRDNQNDVILFMNTEEPNPVPDLEMSQDAVSKGTSSPVSIMFAEGSVVKVDSFIIKNSTSGIEFPTRTISYSTDKLVTPNSVYSIGKQPFEKNTKYKADFIGTVNGVTVKKSWTFTTGIRTPF